MAISRSNKSDKESKLRAISQARGDPSSSKPIIRKNHSGYTKLYRSILSELRDLESKNLFDQDERLKSKEIYRQVLLRMAIYCPCGKTIKGSDISQLFSDLVEDSEKELIDVKGKRRKCCYYPCTEVLFIMKWNY
jgi:Zn-finger protein